METLLLDLRYGFRMLRKNAAFTTIAVLTLGLGIGANTAIFSVVNAVLLRDLPYHDPNQLTLIWSDERAGGGPRSQLSFTDVDDYRTQSHSFVDVVSFGDWSATFSGDQNPERILGMQVSDGYFALMGARPLLGRGFLPEEQIDGKDRVIVLTYGLWQRRFGGDPNVIGKSVTLSNLVYTIVGVMPKDFPMLPESLVAGPAEFYRPEADKRDDQDRTSRHLRAVARLKPGVSLALAQADLDGINRRLAQQFPSFYSTTGVRVVKLQDDIASGVKPALMVLLAAIGFLLLIACANVSNLLLARATVRQKEIAIRTALGASRWQLIRQVLTESVLLALAGGALGVTLASLGTTAITAMGSHAIPQLIGVAMDWRVLIFTFVVSVFTGLLFGLVPALHLSKTTISQTMSEAARGSSAAAGDFRGGLAVTEIALALVLLVGAGLLLRTFAKLRNVDPGFRTDHLLTMNLGLPSAKYPGGSPKPLAFYRELIGRLKELPTVESAAAVSILPLGSDFDTASVDIEGQVFGPGQSPYPERYIVTPGYLDLMGIPMLKGRSFTDTDSENSIPVVLVNETAAEKWWPGQDPIGKRIRPPGYEPKDTVWRTVVGVVRDVKQAGLDAPATMQVYLPHAQYRNGFMVLVVRTKGEPLNLATDVRQQVLGIDPDQAVSNVASMDQVVANGLAAKRFSAALLGTLAALGLLLASVGIYGVLSYGVEQRTREIGIRMALGAARRDVLAMVVGQGLKLLLCGVGIGLIAALVLTRLMSGLLFGVGASDPVTFAGFTLFLGAVALVACYLPARRATRVDPMIALRHE